MINTIKKHYSITRFRNYSDEILKLNGVNVEHHRDEITSILVVLYSGRERIYHNYEHITYMLDKGKLYFPDLTPSEKLAILFHDSIFIVGSKFNEEKSVGFMIELLNAYDVKLTEVCWASRCIYETANFMSDVKDDSTHAVLDLDLCSLADEYDLFVKQNIKIQHEFKASEKDRKSFLLNFLNKEKIFYKLTNLEQKARSNITSYCLG